MVKVLVPEPVTVAGLKLAVAPGGNDPVLRVTTPANAFTDPTVTVYSALLPAVICCDAGAAEIVKSVTANADWAE
jgi:hypothetical protein